MALLNLETVFLNLFKTAHTAEHDLSALAPENLSVAAAAVADVSGVPRWKGDIVSVTGSPIKFQAVDQIWSITRLSLLIMDSLKLASNSSDFVSDNTNKVYMETGTVILRLDTLTGAAESDLALIKDHLGVATNYDFATAGKIVNGTDTAGLVTVTAADGTTAMNDSAVKSDNFDHVYQITLGGKLFGQEKIFVVGGNGTVELQSKDLGDVATQQSGS